jgi:sugar lactone lactonase YvrE
MPILASTNFVNGYGKASVVTAAAGALPLESITETQPDTFVVKYNTLGKAEWSARIGSTGADIGFAIATDSSGNTYVTGQGGLGAIVTAFNSDGTAFGTTLANAGSNDVFIVKYNTNGFVQWVARVASTGADIGYGIATDSSGNVYVTGQGGSGAVVSAFNSNGTAFGTTLPSLGLTDVFIVKYDTNGFVQWVARVISAATDIGFAIATDSSGNVYLTGQGGSGVTVSALNSDGSSFGRSLLNSGSNDAFIVKYNTNGFVQWVARVASTGADIGYGIATDSSGNVYVTGQGGSGAVVTAFNSNATAFGITLANAGSNDAFIVKYDTNGFVQWVARVASSGTDIGFAIATDSSGNVYVTGQGGSGVIVTAFNSNGTAFGTTLPSLGNTDAFILKYDTNGFVQWVARVASIGADIGYGIATDSSGNVYVTGQGGSNQVVTAFNSNGTAFGTTLANAGANDVFIVKYDTNGFVQWLTRLASIGQDITRALTVDGSGNLYITGQFTSTPLSVYGSSISLFSILPNSGDRDAFVVKYSTSGDPQWAARVASTGADIGFAIATDSSGNVYVTGQGSAVVTAFNSDGTAFGTTTTLNDAFIVKYNTNGFVQWIARVGGSGNDVGYGIATDSSGNVYVTGVGASGAVVTAFNSDGTAFGTTLPNSGLNDVFIVKYDTNGFVQWVARVASTGSDIGFAIAIDSSGNVYVTGQSATGVVTAFNSNGTVGRTLANSGSGDAFIVKYDTNGLVQWVARVRGSGTDVGCGIATDSSGNVYVTGQGGATVVTADNSDGTAFGTTLAHSGSGDAFIVKYDTNGFVQWVARVASITADIGFAIATDSSGNVYVTGQGGAAVVTAFNSNGTAFGTTLPNSGSGDAFIVKYNTNGFVQWVTRIGSGSIDIGYGIATDSSGNVYVACEMDSGQVSIFNSDTTLFGVFASPLGIVKYNTNGFAQWFQTITSTGAIRNRGIAVDTTGNSYITGGGATNAVIQINGGGNSSIFRVLSSAGAGSTFITKYSSNGTVEWLSQINGTEADLGFSISADSSGNVYVTGQAGVGAVVTAFNSNGTAFGTTLPSSGNTDAFVVKYDTNGFVQWVARVASTQADIGFAIAIDSSGNVYVTGRGGFAIVTAFNSDGTAFGTTLPTSGNVDAFIVKYNTNGFVQWVARVASTSADNIGYAIATDSSGNVYVTGQSAGLVRAFNSDGTAFGTTLSSSGGSDAFILKYDTNGFVQWVARVASTGIDIGFAIATDSSGNVYVTGQGGPALVTAFNSDGTSFGTTLANAGTGDAFIVKYNTNGFVQWAARVASTQADIGFAIAIDSSGNVYVTGQGGSNEVVTAFNSDGTAFGTTLPSAGNSDAFIVKYDTNGFVQWVARVRTSGADVGTGVRVDSAGDIYVTGRSIGSVVALNSTGTSFGSAFARAVGPATVFVVKYNTNGLVQWISQYAGTNTKTVGGMAIDGSNNIYITGSFTAGYLVSYDA